MKNIDISISRQQAFDGGPNDPEIPDLLELIASLAPKVNAATDKVNTLLRTIEKTLNDLGTGAAGWVNIDPGNVLWKGYRFEPNDRFDNATDDDKAAHDLERRIALLYDRTPSGYRIVLREYIEWTDENGDQENEKIFDKPLLECPRDKKLSVVHYLPELLYEIAEALDRAAKSAEEFANDERLQNALKRLSK